MKPTNTTPEITVTMVGPSGSGKTAFLAGMYHTIIAGTAGGLVLEPVEAPVTQNKTKHPPGKELRDGLIVRGAVRDLAFKGAKYPKSTDVTTLWKFLLRDRGLPVALVNWVDYRGGGFSELSNPNAAADLGRDIMYAHLLSSDVIVLCVDSVYLSRYRDDPHRTNEYARLGELSDFVLEFEQEYNLQVPILIALTKTDSNLIPVELKEHNFAGLLSLAQRGFDRILVSRFRPKRSFVAVGAVGEEAADDKVRVMDLLPDQIESGIKEPIRPFQCDLPLCFAVFKALSADHSLLQDRCNRLADSIKYLENRIDDASLMEHIVHAATRFKTMQRELASHEKSLRQGRHALAHLDDTIGLLAKRLDGKVREI